MHQEMILLRRIADIGLATGILFLMAPWLAVYAFGIIIITRLVPRHRSGTGHNLLRIVQGDYDIIRRKDVFFVFYEDEQSFAHTFVMCYPAWHFRRIAHSTTLTFIEIPLFGRVLKRIKLPITYMLLNSLVFFTIVLAYAPWVRKSVSLVRGSDPHHTGFAAMLLGLIADIPYCISLHAHYGMIFDRTGQFYLSGLPNATIRMFRLWAERLVLAHARSVIAINDYIRQYAESRGAISCRVTVLRHGVSVERFTGNDNVAIRARFSWGDSPLVVIVSRISREKYVFDIPMIAQIVARAIPQAFFTIAGDGPDREAFEEALAKAGIRDTVRILGFQKQEIVSSLRTAADVNLCLYDGYSLIEAALSGRPVVAYDVEWHNELIRNSKTGYLVPNRDVQSAAEAICYLLRHPDEGKRLAAAARELAVRNHSRETVTREKMAFYHSLIHGAN